MIASRAFRLANVLNKSSKGFQCSLNNVPLRNSHGRVAYRTLVPATDKQLKSAEIWGSLVWGWIFYHLINDYDLLFAEYFSPNPALWTDEELGIPPDDAGPYVPNAPM